MRVSCPSCQTEYDVPDAALAGRTRKLRCASCGNQWQAGQAPEPPVAAAPPPPVPPQFTPPPPAPPDAWPHPAAPSEYRPSTAAPDVDDVRTLPDSPYQSPYVPPTLPPRPELPDPQEARNIADRESFAALLESSRQAGAQEPDDAETPNRKRPSAWLISILLILLIAGFAVIERTHIMTAWPPSIRLFEALGLSK